MPTQNTISLLTGVCVCVGGGGGGEGVHILLWTFSMSLYTGGRRSSVV